MDDGFAMGYALGQDSGGNRNSGGGMFDGNGSWIWIIVVFALLFGWGNNGNGNGQGANNGSGGGCAMPTFVPYPVGGGAAFQGGLTRADLCSEFNFNGLETSVRGVQQGICDGFYAQNSALMNGFHGVDNAICGLGNALQQGNNATQLAILQGNNALQAQIAQCCCDNRAALADLKYDMATSDCSIKTLVNQLAQQIMWGQQNGIRDLTDLINNKFCQLEISQKDAVIADLRTQLAQCGDQNMANAIVARLSAVINPPAVPSYPAANPHGCGSWPASYLTCGGNGYGGCNRDCGSCC